MRQQWIVKAEIGMDASRYKTVEVCTNSKKKAIKLAEQELKKQGAFFVMVNFCEPKGPVDKKAEV